MPDIRIVSEQSDAQRRRRLAAEQLEGPLRELAANLLRVMRGAGKPNDLIQQMQAFVTVGEAYQTAHGQWHPVADVIVNTLRIDSASEELYERRKNGDVSQADFDRWTTDGTIDRDDAVYMICRGAMQLCASKLVGQIAQERAGKKELTEGCRILDVAMGKRRKSARRG